LALLRAAVERKRKMGASEADQPAAKRSAAADLKKSEVAAFSRTAR
jgi:hypothetical protein